MTQNVNLIRVLSMGSGVQTTACLLKYYEEYDYVIFADTGGETPETYYYIENYLKPFCKSKDLAWITVKSKLGTLEKYCLDNLQIPSRRFKWCTDKFKRTPLNKKLKELGATKKNPIIKDIGFSLDESHRLGKHKDPQYVKHNYPLLNDKITRRECYNIIESFGFPIPPKSACWFCYNAKKKEVIKLRVNHRDLFDRMSNMEKNAGRNFFNVPLEHYNQIQTLDSFECDSGACFT